MKREMKQKKQRHARKNRERNKRAFTAVMIDFRDQVAGRHVKRDAARKRQRVGDRKTDALPDEIKKQHARQRHQTDQGSAQQNLAKTFPGGENHRGDRKAFRKFMQQNGEKDENPDAEIDLRGGAGLKYKN